MPAYVYALTNRTRGARYTGVTADLPAGMVQHREGKGSRFGAKHGISRLVHVELHDEILGAIPREKQIKKWMRA